MQNLSVDASLTTIVVKNPVRSLNFISDSKLN